MSIKTSDKNNFVLNTQVLGVGITLPSKLLSPKPKQILHLKDGKWTNLDTSDFLGPTK